VFLKQVFEMAEPVINQAMPSNHRSRSHPAG
jgi:hypothetical protein